MKITVLIVDDEPEMIYILKKVVEEYADVEVVGEAADGAEAIELFEEKSPHVVFLDIELPAKDGVTLAREMFDINPNTIIIFATAYSDYREEAFEVYAVDYLVKPFKLERLRQTMARIVSDLTVSSKVNSILLPKKRWNRRIQSNTNRRMLFKTNEKHVCLDLGEIIFVSREGRKSIIYYVGGTIGTNETLSGLEKQFYGYPFFRSHTGYIVNLKMLKEIIPVGRGSYQLVMKGTDQKPLMTDNKFKELKALNAQKRQ